MPPLASPHFRTPYVCTHPDTKCTCHEPRANDDNVVLQNPFLLNLLNGSHIPTTNSNDTPTEEEV